MCMKKLIKDTRAVFAEIPVIGAIFKPKPKVAVVRLFGVIADGGGGGRKPTISYHRFASIIEDAFDADNLQAVALVINSPGGSPAQSELIGKHIRRLAEEKEMPVIGFVEDVAASGGYWLACAADEIYAAETSIIGSIGVISASFGLKELTERHGIERRVHTSGKEKSFLDPFLEEKPADVKRLKILQRDMHDSFINWVKSRRGDKLSGEDKELFEGGFWLAGQALSYGIIDGIGDIKTTMMAQYGEDIKFVEFGPDKGLLSGLLSAEMKLSAPVIGVDEILESIENKAIWGRYGL